ncbi:MAG: DNA-protecting protein DprA [Neisseriaceae bacterium]|nr:MAG: DNA-protecting protein DprA [Neisseriaceae bacterium]
MENDLRQLGTHEHPRGLSEIPEPPETLWIRGILPPPTHKRLAVVGSRALSPYGRTACQKLLAGLSGYPISIVSGLALGTDACAHAAALDAGLHTIAVPGSGLADHTIAPRTNLGLAHRILASGGALLSEYAPDEEAAPWKFPRRNRLMVGMSDAVLVIEAGERSGTLITARLAGEYNRDLLCVPHRIGDAHGYGAHLFLRLGAGLVSESRHILEALGIPMRTEEKSGPPPDLSPDEAVLYTLLTEPLTQDELLRASGLPHTATLTALATLELRGVLTQTFGAWRRV